MNSDVTISGAVTTNTTGAVTVTADDSVTITNTGSISATGTGNVSVTANTDALNGGSNDGITMNGASFINAGTGTTASGTILLRSTGTNGGNILAQDLTARNTITIDSGAGVELQGPVLSNGSLVDINAVTTISSLAPGGTITTTGVANAGAVDIEAGGSVALAGAVDTRGNAAGGNGGLVTIDTGNGDISVAGVDASGVGAGVGADVGLHANGAGVNITLNGVIRTSTIGVARVDSAGSIIDGSNNADDDIIASQVLLRAVTGIGTGDGGDSSDLTIAAVSGGTDISVGAETETGDINILSTASGVTRVTNISGTGDITNLGGGLLITDAGANPATDDNITLISSTGAIVVNQQVMNSDAGDDANSAGNDVTVRAQTNLTINANVTALDGDAATEESVQLVAVTGNILIGNGIVISTDDDETVGVSSETSRDSIEITANGGTGTVEFVGEVTIRTDGGVARQFLLRPVAGTSGTAFFIFPVSPIPSAVSRSGINYVVTFDIEIGVAQEENLRLDIDWRDPTTPSDTANLRLDSFYHDFGKHSISHTYSFFDFGAFVNGLNPIFEVDFSVSQHQSIEVNGGTVRQGAEIGAVAGGKISSTDDVTTGNRPGPFDSFNQGAVDRTVDTVISNTNSQIDFLFEGGRVEIVIPTLGLFIPDPEPNPPAPNPAPAPTPDGPAPLLLAVQAVVQEDAPSPIPQPPSDDYFQLRDQFGNVVSEQFRRIPDEEGELLLQPTELRKWVQKNLQDETGLQLWLITEKPVGSGTVKIARPVLKFDVNNGVPFPSDEVLPDSFEFPQLQLDISDEEMSEDAEASNTNTAEAGASAPPSDEKPETQKAEENEGSQNKNAEGTSAEAPKASNDPEKPAADEQPQAASSTLQRSAMASVAVAAVLNRPQAVSNGLSRSRKLLNQLLNQR